MLLIVEMVAGELQTCHLFPLNSLINILDLCEFTTFTCQPCQNFYAFMARLFYECPLVFLTCEKLELVFPFKSTSFRFVSCVPSLCL